MGCTEEGSMWDFCMSLSPDVLNHISLSGGWIIAMLRNYEYSNYGSTTFITGRQRIEKLQSLNVTSPSYVLVAVHSLAL